MDDDEKLVELREKYGSLITEWLLKNTSEHKMYQFFATANDMLCGLLKPSGFYKIKSLEKMLKKFFPQAEVIVISDSDDDDDDKKDIPEVPVIDVIEKSKDSSVETSKKTIMPRRPSIHVPSISGYSMKTQKLPPASTYAKKSNVDKPTFSINYKETKPSIKKPYDPKEEAIKLDNIKERIYCKQFLKMEAKKEVEEKETGYSSDNELKKKSSFKLRKRAISMYAEAPIELSNSEDKFVKIPKLKVCRPAKRGRKRNQFIKIKNCLF